MGWYDETMDILGAIAKLDYFWELFINILGFFKVKLKIWNTFWGLLTSINFGGMPDTSNILGGLTVDDWSKFSLFPEAGMVRVGISRIWAQLLIAQSLRSNMDFSTWIKKL